MMHKFSKTGEYAKKRLKIALAEDRNTISSSDNMAQIKKEIKSVIQRHMNINDDAAGITYRLGYFLLRMIACLIRQERFKMSRIL
jgi:cell division topological specificity factor MinE